MSGKQSSSASAAAADLERRRRMGQVLAETCWTDLGICDCGSGSSNSKDHDDDDDDDRPASIRSSNDCAVRGIDNDDENDDAALCILERLVELHIASTTASYTASTAAAIPHPQDRAASNTSVNAAHEEESTPIPTNSNELLAADAPWRSDLRHFVLAIKSLYNPVPFHSYYHATHVTLSANRLMEGLSKSDDNFGGTRSSIDDERSNERRKRRSSYASSQQSQPLGNVVTPLEKTAFVFTALIHDVSHVGISNAQLEMENHPVHLAYSDPIHLSSYAECHSVDVGLDLLRGGEQYHGLRTILFGPKSENESSFDSLVRHLVICTDIASADRRRLAMERYKESFGEGMSRGESDEDEDKDEVASFCSEDSGGPLSSPPVLDDEVGRLRRRTMLEQLMQLSDVAHLTQSWENFLKWNERLYLELIEAYRRRIRDGAEDRLMDGENGSDDEVQKPKTPPPHPSEGWFEGQIGFCDYYIIPLAKRVEECGALESDMGRAIVKGARMNRERWVREGKDATERMIASAAAAAAAAEYDDACSGSLHRAEDMSEFQANSSSLTAPRGIYQADSAASLSTCGSESFGSRSLPLAEIGSTSSARPPPTVKRTSVNSVDATVPRILAGQILRSIEERYRIGPTAVEGKCQTEGGSIGRAIASYWQTGSIERYRSALLFIDISGFTGLAQLYEVDHFRTFINQYFTKIIDIVTSHGGEVVKFAGDALYAVWTTPLETDMSANNDQEHGLNVSRCIACGVAINAKCNDYRVAKTYAQRESASGSSSRMKRSSVDMTSTKHKSLGELRLVDTVNVDADGKGYEEKVGFLNVHCGVGEGIVAGVNVCARHRSEYFLIGKPLADVAQAEAHADAGELVISPSVKDCLATCKASITSKLLQRIDFVEIGGRGFFKVVAASSVDGEGCSNVPEANVCDQVYPRSHRLVDTILSSMCPSIATDDEVGSNEVGADRAKTVKWVERLTYSSTSIDDIKSDGASVNAEEESPDQDVAALRSDIISIMVSHSHESVRDVNENMMCAELRNVVVLFVKIFYEPQLLTSVGWQQDDEAILERFQCIFNAIHCCLSARKGQVRQFISDDKGTVCLASFGLRGSATLNLAATAIEAAKDIQRQLLQVADTSCTIGITFGKAFCGETGSPSRHEFSIMGSSVNLSARLMASGARGTINCDDEVVQNDADHQFTCAFKHKLKGYNRPVSFYNPAVGDKDERILHDGADNLHISVRQNEIHTLVEHIGRQQDQLEKEQERAEIGAGGESHDERTVISGPQPRAILISERDGSGKDFFIKAVLEHPAIQARTTVLVANHCYHNTPFYCWVPIISRIVKTSREVAKRIGKLKRFRHKLNIPPSLLSDAVDIKPFELVGNNNALVTEELLPYLALLNDFIFQGFPLFRSTEQVSTIKDAQKVDKAVEVVASMILLYLIRCKKSAIIAVNDIDSADEYSKQLVLRLFNNETKLIFICSSKKGSRGSRKSSLSSIDSETSVDALDSVFGQCDEERTELMRLEPLGQDAIFQVFKTSLKGLSKDDSVMLDGPEIIELVHELCGGSPKYAVEFAHAVSIELRRQEKLSSSSTSDHCVVQLLDDFPLSKMEELITFRFDALSPEAQVLLKVASVAGFDQYSFSLNLLETLMLDSSTDDKSGCNSENGIPLSAVQANEFALERIFQGGSFEALVQSLVEQSFLVNIEAETADYLGDEGTQSYRFANALEQTVINELMLEDQKKELHMTLAEYYERRLLGLADDNEYLLDDYTDEGSISTLTTSFTVGTVARQSWQMAHLTATHYSQSGVAMKALLYFFDAATELAGLGLRDKSHGLLLSAYSMFEKLLRQCLHQEDEGKSLKVDKDSRERNRLAKRLVQLICDTDVPPTLQSLTQQHLKCMFDGDSNAFVMCVKMLFKFGQSIGIIEKEGYVHGAKVYQQVVFLTLLGLSQEAFQQTVSQLREYLDDDLETSAHVDDKDELFCIDDLTVCFPAFSGLLTFYRDSPIQNKSNLTREKILATLFVAITEQQSDMVHILRTKCILSHLYMKTGDVDKALEVSESIKADYNHDKHSLSIVQIYGMDWVLININTMVSVYILRGNIVRALDSISFLEMQLIKIDEFASSTKAMLKGLISAAYLLLRRFDKAVTISNGISMTSYGFFYKPSSILQEGLNKKLEQLNNSLHVIDTNTSSVFPSDLPEQLPKINDPNDIFSNDYNVLEILETDRRNVVCLNRSMLHPSIEVLSDRGIEAIEAAICMAQVEWLEETKKLDRGQKGPDDDVTNEQMRYCEAGLAHLAQSLGQNDAASHEKRTNYLSCLYQRAELLSWRSRLRRQKLDSRELSGPSSGSNGLSQSSCSSPPDVEEANMVLRECESICDEYGYYLMLLMVGGRFISLELDPRHGQEVVARALEHIESSRSPKDLSYAQSIYQSLCHRQCPLEYC